MLVGRSLIHNVTDSVSKSYSVLSDTIHTLSTVKALVMPRKIPDSSQDARWVGGASARQGPPGREFSRLLAHKKWLRHSLAPSRGGLTKSSLLAEKRSDQE